MNHELRIMKGEKGGGNCIEHGRTLKGTSLAFSVLILCGLWFLIPAEVFAASLQVVPQAVAVGVSQEIRFDVVLDTNGATVNAVSGEIGLPEELSFSRIEDGWSIIGMWVERPEKRDSTVTFSGIVPNGFSGIGVLFSIFAEGVREGAAVVEVKNGRALLNDGTGTPLALQTPPAQFSVVRKLTVSLPEIEPDRSAPLSFTPLIGQSVDLFDGRYFVMFNTVDPGSGVEHYELHESRREVSKERLRSRSVGWRRVENPTALRDQTLHSFVYIKAVDRSGNSEVAMLLPPRGEGGQSTFNNRTALGILVMILAVVCVRFFVQQKFAQQKKFRDVNNP